MKTLPIWLAGLAFAILPVHGQQVKRHPGDVLHYQVTLEGGDIGKLVTVGIVLTTPTVPPNQLGSINGLRGSCVKSSAGPNVWDCSATIPPTVSDGNYRLTEVTVAAAGLLRKSYEEDFHLPVVPIENPMTFNPPTKVSVKEQP